MPKHPDPTQHQTGDGLDEESFRKSSEAWFDTAMLVGQ
jgi:hypothetical protein